MAGQGNGFNIRQYDIYWGEDKLGFTAENSVDIPIQGLGTDVLSDQVEGVNSVIPRGVIPGDELAMILQNSNFDYIIGTLLKGQIETITSGNQQAGGIGFKIRNAEDIVKPLRYHPTGVDRSDKSNDILLHKAYPLANFSLTSNKEEIQQLAISFRAIPDNNQPVGFQYGIMGDDSLVEATPAYVAITLSRETCQPVISIPALSLPAGHTERVNTKKVFMVDDTVTMDFNNVANYTASIVTLEFDNLSSANSIAIGDYIKMGATGSERAYVEGVSYTTGTSGTLTVIRGVNNGGVGEAGADNDVFTLQKDVGIQDARDSAIYLSSSPSNVTVGDIFPGTGVTRKGVLHNVATGSANITATVGAVSSPNLVVTAI